MRRFGSALIVVLAAAGIAVGADKELKGKIVKIDAAKKTLSLLTDDGKKELRLSEDTKVFGVKGKETTTASRKWPAVSIARNAFSTPSRGKGIAQMSMRRSGL